MAASSLPGARMQRQGWGLVLWTKPSGQPLLHITKLPSSPCPRGCSRLSLFLSRGVAGKLC